MCCLAVWQIHRMHWKEGVIAQMHAALTTQPLSVAEMLADPEKNIFRRVHITGQWGVGTNIFVIGKIHNKRPGQHLFNIVTLENGDNLLVNIGWVQKKNMVQRGSFKADFVGRIRTPPKKSWFTPNHYPSKREWSFIDTQDIAQSLGIRLLPFYVDYVREDTGRVPYPIPDIIAVPNNHLGYVVTWFGLALAWAVIFGILAMRKRREYEYAQL